MQSVDGGLTLWMRVHKLTQPLSPVSIQTHATHATQALALRPLRAMRVLRKRKLQATQALDWLLRSTIPIWLALAFVA